MKTAAATIIAQEAPKPSFANIKIETVPKKATFTFQVVNDSPAIVKFKIEYGTDPGALNKESITFEKSKILVKTGATASRAVTPVSFRLFPIVHAESGDSNNFLTASTSGVTSSNTNTATGLNNLGTRSDVSGGPGGVVVGGAEYKTPTDSIVGAKESVSLAGDTTTPAYTWYVDGLTEPKYYARITALDAAGSPISGVQSDILEIDTSLNAAGKCMIANISGIKITKKDDTSIISWDALPEAQSYNVYKKDATGKYVLIENIKTNSYTVHIAKGEVKYEDFAIKAVCSDSMTLSADYGEAVKVQTGPGKIALLAILALGIGFVVSRRKFAFLKNR